MEFLKRRADDIREWFPGLRPEAEEQQKPAIRCLLVGSEKAQRVAIARIKATKLSVELTTDVDRALQGERSFNCVVLMIDAKEPSAIDLVYRFTQKFVNKDMHPTRIAFTIAPGLTDKTGPLLLYLHKVMPNNPYFIDYGKGEAVELALTRMLATN